MVWVASFISVLIAAVIVLAASPESGAVMFEARPNALAEAAQDWQIWFGLIAAVVVAFWFTISFGRWSELGDDSGWNGDLPKLEQPRAFTTSLRFWLWSVLYGAFVSGAFLIVVFFPDIAGQIITAVGEIVGNDDLLSIDILGGGVVTGTLMAGLFARSVWESKLRRFFQKRALIPEEARRIYQELVRTVFDFRPPDKDLDVFIEEQKQDNRTPTYFDFEFEQNIVQQADRRMELLPRIAFMCWQTERLRPNHPGFAALHRSSKEIDKMKECVEAFEKKAMACSHQLLSVLDGLIELEAAIASDPFVGANDADNAARQMDVRARVAADTDLNVEWIEAQSLPVSRLDNIAQTLVQELESLGDRLGRYNELQAMKDRSALEQLARSAGVREMAEQAANFTHENSDAQTHALGRDYERLKARLDTLRAQIAAVQRSLVPVSIGRLNALDEKMETENPELVSLANRFIGVIVCAGLAAEATPNRHFFQAFGLNPTLGKVRFRFERALGLVLLPLVIYFGVLISKSVMQDDQNFDFAIWFLFGTMFIAGSIIYGCIHGAALASVALERDRAIVQAGNLIQGGARRNFKLMYGVSTFVFSTAFLIIGVYGLCMMLAVSNGGESIGSDRAHTTFRGAWPFAAVAAVWSVLCAYVTFRASLNVGTVILRRDWLMFPLGSLIVLGLVFGFLKSALIGSGVPWLMLLVLVPVLTVAVVGGAKWTLVEPN